MKAKLYFQYNADGTDDNIVLEGEDTNEIMEEVAIQLKMRGATFAGLERLED